jgi:hypothetical protein
MAIPANRAYQLAKTVKAARPRGLVATLGAQTVTTTDEDLERIAAALGLRLGKGQLFERLGLSGLESIDISDFEGATHLFDLNAPGVPQHLKGRFGWVFNGGTIEHVFHVPNALRNVFELLSPDGVVTHGGPVNGWVDHGFYQFSPTLFLDYYFANRFEILEAEIVEADKDDPDLWRITPYYPGAFDGTGTYVGGVRWNLYFTARKTSRSTWDQIPQQSYYQRIYGDAAKIAAASSLAHFEPYALKHGAAKPLRLGNK